MFFTDAIFRVIFKVWDIWICFPLQKYKVPFQCSIHCLGEKNLYPKSPVFCCPIEKVLIKEGEKKVGMDTNKLHINLLNRLLYCSTTMQFLPQKNNSSIKNNRIYIYCKGRFIKVKQDPVLKFLSDGNHHTRNKHEIILHIFSLLIQKR